MMFMMFMMFMALCLPHLTTYKSKEIPCWSLSSTFPISGSWLRLSGCEYHDFNISLRRSRSTWHCKVLGQNGGSSSGQGRKTHCCAGHELDIFNCIHIATPLLAERRADKSLWHDLLTHLNSLRFSKMFYDQPRAEFLDHVMELLDTLDRFHHRFLS